MPTIQAQPIDVQWVTILDNATTYTGYPAAFAAAVALSAANSNASVQICKTASAVIAPGTVQQPGNGSPIYFVQLASASTVYPENTATLAAYTLSAANSNQRVFVCRIIQRVVATP